MPKKQQESDAAADAKEEQVEDPPAVKELKTICDSYLEVEREYERELNDIIAKYNVKRKPILEQRAKFLSEGEDKASGTPAVKGFWLQALENHPAMEGEIQKWDKPILEYLQDIQAVDLDEKDEKKGFRLRFVFKENPYFENAILSKEYHLVQESPYSAELDATQINGCEIKWKDGKDVTWEMKEKKVKGGGAKKKKAAAKASKEPRDSFFRDLTHTMNKNGPVPEGIDLGEIAMGMGMDEDDADEESLLNLLIQQDYEVAEAIKDEIIPWAVRWYTGEAAPDRDDDDEDGESELDESDDDEDESSEDEKPKGKKGGAKKSPQTGAKKSPQTGPKKSPKLGAAGDPKQEECKQQ